MLSIVTEFFVFGPLLLFGPCSGVQALAFALPFVCGPLLLWFGHCFCLQPYFLALAFGIRPSFCFRPLLVFGPCFGVCALAFALSFVCRPLLLCFGPCFCFCTLPFWPLLLVFALHFVFGHCFCVWAFACGIFLFFSRFIDR